MSSFDKIKYNHETQMATFQFEFGHEYNDQADAFFKIYKIEQMLLFHDSKERVLKPKKDRVCRFCGKSFPDVTFKNKAHLIPQLLGNKKLLSDFECDICNKKFGCFENELANYIGITRTITGLTGKEGVPKFKSPDTQFSTWLDENKHLTFSENIRGKNVSIDDENKTITFKADIHPFNALMLYKCFVKIALSIIKDKDIQDFTKSIDFLKTNDIEQFDNSLAAIHEYAIPGPFFNYAMFFSCIKNESVNDNLIPTRTFVLYFRNYMIQYFIPFDRNDKEVNIPKCKPKMSLLPPLVNQDWINKYGRPISELISLNKNQKITNRSETITMKYQ